MTLDIHRKALRYYLNFAEAYAEIGQTDSCSYYSDVLAQEIESNDKLPLKASAFFFLATQARKNHNYDQAFDSQQKYAQLVGKVTRDSHHLHGLPILNSQRPNSKFVCCPMPDYQVWK